MDGILDDSIRHAFDPRDIPDKDERIIMPNPSRDLAAFPDFDGLNPVRREGSQRPRDYDFPMGYGNNNPGDMLERPTRAGCVAIEVPLVSGPVYSMAGALAGWSLIGYDPAEVGPVVGIRGYFRDRTPNGALLSYVAQIIASDGTMSAANTEMFQFPINFSSLYFDRPLTATVASYARLIAYVIPTE